MKMFEHIKGLFDHLFDRCEPPKKPLERNVEPPIFKKKLKIEINLPDCLKMKTRIVKRTNVDGRVEYVIQQKHFLFRWWWVDAWVNSMAGAACRDSFDTQEEALENICYFNGSISKEEVVNGK